MKPATKNEAPKPLFGGAPLDGPSQDQLAQMESGEFLFAPTVRAALQSAAQGNERARAEVVRRLEERLLGLAQPAAADVTEARALGHSRP